MNTVYTPETQQSIGNISPATKVGIIGAGLAGLSCGYSLAKQNVEFQVFEASHRIGGRIMTYQHCTGETAELGAGYFHDHYSAFLDLVNELGLAERVVHRKASKQIGFSRDGTAINLEKTSKDIKASIDFLNQYALLHCEKGNQLLLKYYKNEKNFINTVYEDQYWIDSICTPFTESHVYKNLDSVTQEYFIRPFVRKQLSSNPENVSLMTAMGAIGGAMFALKTLQGGLNILPVALFARIKPFVSLGTPVTKIAQQGKQWVLTLKNNEIYMCDVLVTSTISGSIKNFSKYKTDMLYGHTNVFIVEGELKSSYRNIDTLFSRNEGHHIDGITRYGKNLFKVNSFQEFPKMNFFFKSFNILTSQSWKRAIPQFPVSKIYPSEDLSENLYLVGDHWLPCMELSVITGRKVARKLLAVL